jgi:DNA-directed RNA polymerase specialized sigma24 family protein
MFEIEGFSLEEISDILKKPLGTVKSRLFHGRKELAVYMRHYLDGNQ